MTALGSNVPTRHLCTLALVALFITSCRAQTAPPRSPTTAAPFAAAKAIAVDEHDVEFPDVRFRDGRVLPRARIHYSTAGTPRRDARGKIVNAVLMLHWTGSSSDVLQSRAFADALYAPGKPLDLSRYFLVFVDAVGHGRSSKPSDGMRASFPAYGYEDIVTLQYRTVTEALGLDHLHAIVGLSMGGMNAWQWAERYPDFMDAIMPVVAQPVPISGRNLVWRRFVAARSATTLRGTTATTRHRRVDGSSRSPSSG